MGLLAAALLAASPAFADEPAASAAAKPALAVAAMAGPFGKPVTLRGTLGKDAVQMRLQPKTEEIDSVEGDYLVQGHAGKILLAGEVTGNALSMEESQDGVDVSGQWDGKLEGKMLRGTWTSDDGSITKEFVLKLEASPIKAAKPAKKSSK
jgi:hypothetical protein